MANHIRDDRTNNILLCPRIWSHARCDHSICTSDKCPFVQNVCHLLPKIEELKIILHDKSSVNIFRVCETFLHDDIDNSLLEIEGFDFERRDRDVGSGGGILMYISSHIQYRHRHDLEKSDIETIRIEVLIPNSKSVAIH